jgi:glutathione synthase/RimK-type ligase-like ATP-grasp enzyme
MEKIMIRKFQDFIKENYSEPEEFRRFYMLVKLPFPLDSENELGRIIGTVRNELFDQVKLEKTNVDQIALKADIPVINFTEDGDLVIKLLNNGGLQNSSLYNHPSKSALVSDKGIFHKTFADCSFVPNTVFTLKDAFELKFPVIAKPAQGKSAEGIKKFNTPEELQKSQDEFDVFSEMIDILKEFRCFCFRDHVIELDERIKIGDEDFLKDTSTTTNFFYKKIDLSDYDHNEKLQELLKSCRSLVDLDFFSVDFAQAPDGSLHLIEMNSRTGMGADKMVELYKLVHDDFYGKTPGKDSSKKLERISSDWKEAYSRNKGSQMNECTAVAGKLDGVSFLFKNRDRSFTPDTKIIREKIDGTEIVYYSDQTGWVEGMNEHGVGFVFTQLTGKEWKGYSPSYTVSDEPKDDSKFKPFAEKIKKMLTAKNADEAIKLLNDSNKSGSFLIGDNDIVYEVEVFNGKMKKRKLSFDDSPYYTKTNHGELFPGAGHQPSGDSIKRASTSIRRHQAKIQLQGIEDISEIPLRMKFQAFDPSSSLNIFRTDSEEYTISQCLMDLSNLKFYFFHDNSTADSISIEDNMKNPKISIDIRKIQ